MRCIPVTIIDDNVVESEVDQFFTFVLQSGLRTLVTSGSTQINIRDNDGNTTVYVSSTCFVNVLINSIDFNSMQLPQLQWKKQQ